MRRPHKFGTPHERTSALITGISGQDGSYLAELLVAKGYDVTAWSVTGRSRIPNLAGVRDRVGAGRR